VRSNRELGTCTAGGVEILDLHATVAPRRQGVHAAPTLESHTFVPYVESNLASLSGDSSVAEYAEICSCLVSQKLHNLIETGTDNGLQNRQMMCRLFSKETSTYGSVPAEKLTKYLEASDCCLLKALDKILSVEHTEKFVENVRSVASSAGPDIAVVDRLSGFVRADRCFKTCLDVVLENLSVEGSDTRIKVVECDASIGQAYRHTVHQLLSQPAVSVKYFATDSSFSSSANDEFAEKLGVTSVDWSLNSTKPIPDQIKKSDLVILANVLHRQPNLAIALRTSAEVMSDCGFLLVVEPTLNFGIPWALFALANDLEVMSDLSSRSFGPYCNELTWTNLFLDAGLEVVAKKSDGLLNTVFLCRRVVAHPNVVSINVDGSSFSWLEEVKAVMVNEQASSDTVWLKSTLHPSNGIVGMMNCLRREPNGSRLRYNLL